MVVKYEATWLLVKSIFAGHPGAFWHTALNYSSLVSVYTMSAETERYCKSKVSHGWSHRFSHNPESKVKPSGYHASPHIFPCTIQLGTLFFYGWLVGLHVDWQDTACLQHLQAISSCHLRKATAGNKLAFACYFPQIVVEIWRTWH